MRVLQLISSAGFFGAEKVLLQLVQSQKKSDPRSAVAGLILNRHRPHSEIVQEYRRQGIEPVNFSSNGRFDLKAIRDLRHYIREAAVDVVHSHGYKSDTYAFIASVRLPVWRVATCHNWIEDTPLLKVYAAMDRWCLRFFHRVVAVSQSVRVKLLKSGIAANRIETIPNGIDFKSFGKGEARERVRGELGIGRSAIVVGTVGRLSREKGQEILLEAACTLKERHPETIYLVVGEGPDRARLEEKFASDRIRFTGYCRDVATLLEAMDIFVLPSLTEGLPLALLEAMASHLPVVATRVGEVPSVIQEGVSGLIVDPGAAAGLVAAIRRLVGDPCLRKKMGEEGRLSVERHYGCEAMGKAYKALYEGLNGKASLHAV